MLDLGTRVTNILSVLLNRTVVKQLGIELDQVRRPFKILAFLSNQNEAEAIKTMFSLHLGCGYGCPSSCVKVQDYNGIENVIVIRRPTGHVDAIEVFDMLVSIITTQ